MTDTQLAEIYAQRDCVDLLLSIMLACDQRRFLMERLGVWRKRITQGANQ